MRATFNCPWCHHGVSLRGGYFRVIYLLAIVVSGLISYAAGFRRDALFAMTCLGVLPVFWVMLRISLTLFPPETIQTGDYQGILYGLPAFDADDLAAEALAPTEDRAASTSSSRSAQQTILDVRPEPKSLEGIVLRLGTLVLVLSMVWMAAEPALYRLFPRFMGTRTGPVEFPVRVVIGEHGVELANGSTTSWLCSVGTNSGPDRARVESSSLAIPSGDTRILDYGTFGGNPHADVFELVADLRVSLRVSCTDTAGHRYFKEFSDAGLPAIVR